MTCDPNTLSRLSSCLRCLTDAQLMLARTYLLCQWASREMGFAVPPPSSAQWTWVESGLSAQASIIGGSCPAGADGFDLGAIASPGNPRLAVSGNGACGATLSKVFNNGDTALAVIRWTKTGLPVSDWSGIKSLVINSNGLLTGLVAYWKFDEAGSPATFADAVNGFTGTNNNGIIANGATGKINNGIFIQNNNQGVTVSNTLDLRASATPFSVALWFQIQGIQAGGAMIGEWGATRNDFVLFCSSAPLQSIISFVASDDAAVTTQIDGPQIGLFAWTYFVFGFDGSKIFMYINAGAPITAAKAAVRRGGGSFIIGNYQGLTLPVPGYIDEVAYYNRALSAAEVSLLYNGGAGLPLSSFS